SRRKEVDATPSAARSLTPPSRSGSSRVRARRSPPLLRINLSSDPDDGFVLPGSFVLDTGQQTFTTAGEVTMNLVAVHGDDPNQPIPIFQQHQTTAVDPILQDFNIPTLFGFGVSINAKSAQPTTFSVVDWVDFQMTGLALSDDGTGGKVGMQGTGSISSANGVDFSKVGFIKDLVVK